MQLAGDPALRTESARAAVRANRESVLRRAGIGTPVVDYETVFNGFAAALTPQQRERVRRDPGVRQIWKNERRIVETISTPAFLGLDGPARARGAQPHRGAPGSSAAATAPPPTRRCR
ncbi:protease inhibitor I9 family protein [Dactylosporangium sp. NPDC049140]|uniref:protease inhibitor I9 family protein n=1 Tax=Dactylosporangium sp. NPDC049140 TaxID=3155647 RepID=UPI0033EC0D9D